MLGLFPFITMFLVTSIAMLRERTGGTLERLMTMPLAKLDLLTGYGVAFASVAVVQAGITAAVAFGALGLEAAGSTWLIVALAVGNAVLGMALGLFLSAFASSEFQAVQFMPAFVLPQLLLCGLFVPRDQMSAALEVISRAPPDLRLRRAAAGGDRRGRGGRHPARHRGDRRRNAAGARARRRHAAPPNRLITDEPRGLQPFPRERHRA